ncbi:MAG: polyprenyl synthetase family protein [Coriobacteriales bacterium]|jgi:geranylgeranyl diphosphate synthase type I
MDFAEYLSENAHIVNDYLDTYFDAEKDVDIRKYLYDPLQEYTSNAGKRHRPLICMLACSAVGGNPMDALSSGAAVEHFHTAALIHDDIADESLIRRGKPCMHIAIGVGLAINAGDMALSSVMSSVVDDPSLDDHVKVRLVKELVDMDARTIEGQALDVGWARDRRYDITVDDYVKMATHKTAYYSGGVPLAIGAIVGGGSDEQVEALRHFGMLTGLAFQIQDDLLNLVGEAESTRKDFRSDITEGKRTFAVAHALQDSSVRDELIEILDSKTTDPAKLERAVELLEKSGSIAAARSYARNLIEEAKRGLVGSIEDSESRDLLLSMADYFVERLG